MKRRPSGRICGRLGAGRRSCKSCTAPSAICRRWHLSEWHQVARFARQLARPAGSPSRSTRLASRRWATLWLFSQPTSSALLGLAGRDLPRAHLWARAEPIWRHARHFSPESGAFWPPPPPPPRPSSGPLSGEPARGRRVKSDLAGPELSLSQPTSQPGGWPAGLVTLAGRPTRSLARAACPG